MECVELMHGMRQPHGRSGRGSATEVGHQDVIHGLWSELEIGDKALGNCNQLMELMGLYGL